ncbi:MAG: hypothetical protein EPN79_15870 [Burkholderiaceae bacterium]|nr:MAG: hypothetical protein EPN79_15870 [Burkholderiaceae bacterium]
MTRLVYSKENITVLEVNGKPFAVGLLWKPLRSARKHMAEAKQIGKREGMEMVAIRSGKVLQAGFAPKQKARRGQKAESMRGMYSLAAALAGVLGEDWIAVFEISDELYALVAVHKGDILPGRDMVGDQDSVNDLLRETYSDIKGTGVSPRVVAPASWGFGGEELTLDELLPAKVLRKEYRLKPLTLGLTPRELAAIALLVLLLGGAGIGAKIWWNARQAKIAEQQREREAQAAQASAAAKMAAANAAVVRPWQVTPSAEEFLRACAAAWPHAYLSVGGWPFDSGQCVLGKGGNRQDDIVLVHYKRDLTTSVDVFMAAAQALGASAKVDDDGEGASLAMRLPVQAPSNAATDAALPPVGAQLLQIVSRLQSIPDGVAKYNVVPVPWVPPPNNHDAQPPGWQTSTFSMQVHQLEPDQLLVEAEPPGLRIYKVELSVGKAGETDWKLEGELYGK